MALLNTWASQQDQASLSPLDRALNNYIQQGDAPLAYLMRGDAQGLLKDLNTPKPVNMTQDMANAALNLNPVMGLIGATAFHGSPYLFDKFDVSKINSGQGAQSYGHGIYFAENPAVAKEYANELGKDITINNNPLLSMGKRPSMSTNVSGNSFLDDFLVANLGDVKATRKDILDSVKVMKEAGNEKAVKEYQGLLSDLRKVRGNVEIKNSGNLYKVDIPDESMPKMLDWDMPMNKQSPEVLKALKIPTEQVQKYNTITDRLNELQWSKGGLDSPEWNKLTEEANTIRSKYGLGRTGEELYTEAARIAYANKNANPSKVAADSLLQQGITGIRYLDQGSRKTGGTSNFVVFDPSEVKILEKGLLK